MEQNTETLENSYPRETNIETAMIMAQKILDMFNEARATPREQKLALDAAEAVVRERMYR